ncbi:MAG TPA: sigma 54-interacting transcriptional regulator, partial [Candidatus Bathyarchaeia archaeon]|nr:sigma 54-interacting transcriptional regulator [Candidatus Bathyarchaeia archaeon]
DAAQVQRKKEMEMEKLRDPSIEQYLTLLEVSKSIASHRALPELFHDLAKSLDEILDFHFLTVVLHDAARNVMRLHILDTTVPATLQAGEEFTMEESPSALVWRTQQPLIIDDIERETRFARVTKLLREQKVRSFCSLPLTSAHRRLGTLDFGAEETGAYTPDGIAFPLLVASQVAVAVDNALHFQEAQALQSQLTHDRNRLQFLLDLNNRVVSNLDLRQLFQTISQDVRRVMQCDYASLSLPEAANKQFRLYALDFPESKGFLQEEMIHAIKEGSPSRTAIRTMRPLVLQSPFTGWLDFPTVQAAVREGLKSFCYLPLISRDRAIGTLNLGRLRDDAFSEEDLHFLGQVARQVAIAVENALDYGQITESRERLAEERRYLKEELRTEHVFEEIIGESSALKHALKQVETVAPTNSTVLILGETGTGKELVARAIHNLSSRKDHAFVKVNCAAIPLGLLESELFGHERGAFTGAIARRIGRFELAHQGTMFLDEVGDIPPELQPKLLRVLQEQEFERLGSTHTTRVDVRMVAATSRDLTQMIADKEFRGDLYYRLNIFPIATPPLRERPEDIPLLVRHFVEKYAALMDKKIETIPPEAMEWLARYHWPGNIRELQNFIERAVILSPGNVLRPPLSELKQSVGEARTQAGTLEEVQRDRILSALQETKWVIGGPKGAAA